MAPLSYGRIHNGGIFRHLGFPGGDGLQARILLADDERDIHELLTPLLEREGFQVLHAYDGPHALEMGRKEAPDLMLLDVMLPGMDGFEVCRELRRDRSFPILFLSARGEQMDKVLGLGIGGDDYVTKPFGPSEVVARVKAHLRRRHMDKEEREDLEGRIDLPGLSIDSGTAEVLLASGRRASLSALELRVLMALARRPGRIWTKKQLYEAAWESPYLGDDNTVMVTIRRLREKIEDDPDRPQLIQTVRGLGYKLVPQGGNR